MRNDRIGSALLDSPRATILFAGGGTGGHLMPGLGVAQDLRERLGESVRLAFVGTASPLEHNMVESRGFEFLSLPSLKLTGGAAGMPRWALQSAGGLLAARKVIAQVAPNIVVSLGGHAAVAPSLAATLADIPLVIMEQNALPGKANRLLSWWAREVYAPWPGTEASFAYPERVHVTGNPVRRDLAVRRTAQMAARFGLSPARKTLLVMGGSQGAQFINRCVIEALPLLEAEREKIQILHSADALGYEQTRDAYRERNIQAAVFPFIDDMASAYALADLALCRAGGTTLAELTALGIPAVLIPLPIAANDHQRRNASFAAGAGAAFLVDQSDLSGPRLVSIMLNLLQNETCLSRMRAASQRLGRPMATQIVSDRLLALLPPAPRRASAPETISAAQGA